MSKSTDKILGKKSKPSQKKVVALTVLSTVAIIAVVGAIGYVGFKVGVSYERNQNKTVEAKVSEVVSRVQSKQ